MSRFADEYLLDLADFDWVASLSEWSWLLPSSFTVWLVNRFSELFLVLDDGTIHHLKTTSGELNQVASDRDDFMLRVDEPDNARDWFMMPLVDELVEQGVALRAGECYSFSKPPTIGGEYDCTNVVVRKVSEHLHICAQIHRQMKDLPDCTKVDLRYSDE